MNRAPSGEVLTIDELSHQLSTLTIEDQGKIIAQAEQIQKAKQTKEAESIKLWETIQAVITLLLSAWYPKTESEVKDFIRPEIWNNNTDLILSLDIRSSGL